MAGQLDRIARGFANAHNHLAPTAGGWQADQDRVTGSGSYPVPRYDPEVQRRYLAAQHHLANAHEVAGSEGATVVWAGSAVIPTEGRVRVRDDTPIPPDQLINVCRLLQTHWPELHSAEGVQMELDACDHELRPFHSPAAQRRCKRRDCRALLPPWSRAKTCDRCRKRRSRRGRGKRRGRR